MVRPFDKLKAAPHHEGRVTIDDVRAAGHCVRGVRAWFERHGLDFRAFLREGIDEAEFLASGDGLAARIVELKHQRAGRHGR